MKPLTLYWNELSLPESLPEEEADANGTWATYARSAFDTLREVLRLHQQARVSIGKNLFLNEKPFFYWLELWLGKEKVRYIKSKVVQPTEDLVFNSQHLLSVEVRINERVGNGLAFAHLAHSWVWSAANEITRSHRNVIKATEIVLEQNGNLLHTDVDIRNLGTTNHLEHWKESILLWGKELSENQIISHIENYIIIMYFNDHGYPHIHVQSMVDKGKEAKYRIDDFHIFRNEFPSSLDRLIKPWINENKEQLMTSWARCREGLHPLKIQ